MSKSETFSGWLKSMVPLASTVILSGITGLFGGYSLVNFFYTKDIREAVKQLHIQEKVNCFIEKWPQQSRTDEGKKIINSLGLSIEDKTGIIRNQVEVMKLALVLGRRELELSVGIEVSPCNHFDTQDTTSFIREETGYLSAIGEKLRQKKDCSADVVKKHKELQEIAQSIKEYPNGYKLMQEKTLSNGNEITIFTACLAGGAALGWFISKKMTSGIAK